MFEIVASGRLPGRSPTRRSKASSTRLILRALTLLLAITSSGAHAEEAFSDLLVALESDGRSHTVQHTLATEKELLIVDLPGSVIPQDVRFMGPEKDTFRYAHTKRPERIALWSGSAFARYHHQYGSAVEQAETGAFVLTTSSIPEQLILRTNSQILSTITWVFPSEFELERYTVSNESVGQWIEEEKTLTFRQTGSERAELIIEYRYRTPVIASASAEVEADEDVDVEAGAEVKAISGADADTDAEAVIEAEEETDPCDSQTAANDACSPDEDEDGVPDYRDVCLALPTAEPIDTRKLIAKQENTDNGEEGSSPASNNKVGELGCLPTQKLVLEAITFDTGRSYIDIYARRLLDRVANAMQHFPEKVFEIGAHTDNQGTEANNQRLSRKRADAVRHYLMLRGVGPNQVQAKGYGESTPLGDNKTLEGRRINRRVELSELD